jgi:serine/threonine-protein kinase RsbW
MAPERVFEISSRIESIYPLEQRILSVVRSLGFSEDDLFSLRLAMDEALINAIMHGNGGHEHKRVYVSLVTTDDLVQVSVRDEGNGFDINSLFDPTEEGHIHDTHGRGVFLIRQFMTHVTFNEKGNEITFALRRRDSSQCAC